VLTDREEHLITMTMECAILSRTHGDKELNADRLISTTPCRGVIGHCFPSWLTHLHLHQSLQWCIQNKRPSVRANHIRNQMKLKCDRNETHC